MKRPDDRKPIDLRIPVTAAQKAHITSVVPKGEFADWARTELEAAARAVLGDSCGVLESDWPSTSSEDD